MSSIAENGSTGSCPNQTSNTSNKCPVDHSNNLSNPSSSINSTDNINNHNQPQQQNKCPIDHSNSSINSKSPLNPLNNIPNLTQEPQPNQSIKLPTSRTYSSIPSKSGDKWEYPSPQQFYNALLRKGYETPVTEIETMVDIHNWLNEGSWQAIKKWESQFHPECQELKLIKFQGRPHSLSPKAYFYTLFGISDKPFDRHDWTVNRCGRQVRYIIDYYSGKDGPNPEFFVDARPALDSPLDVYDRVKGLFYGCG